MDDRFNLLIDLHIDADRQGPGSRDATLLAIALSGLAGATDLAIADIGCGTGASTLVLAEELDAHVTAVDLLPPFLARLDGAAAEQGLADRITTRACSMDELGFDDGSLDVIWSEGAIYNIGFEHGVRSWRRYLKPGGVLAVSEITWLTCQRPTELENYWATEYPEVATASAKLAVLEAAGYSPMGYFALPAACWLDNYYRPMQHRFAEFLDRHNQSAPAKQIVESEQDEIRLYEQFSAFVSYGFYIAARTEE
jgi:SAM-dependent methyltransferase